MVGILNPWWTGASLTSSEKGDSLFHCAISSSIAIALSCSLNSWIWVPLGLGWALTHRTDEVADLLIDGELLRLLLRVFLKSCLWRRSSILLFRPSLSNTDPCGRDCLGTHDWTACNMVLRDLFMVILRRGIGVALCPRRTCLCSSVRALGPTWACWFL